MSALRPFAHVVGTHREPGARQLLHVALGSIPTRVEPEAVRRLVADECDAPMTELEQVAGGEDAAFDIVGQDGRQDGVRRVDEHAGDLSRLEAYELDLGRDERDHEQPVGPVAAPERVERPTLAVRRLDVEQRQVVRRRLEPGDDSTQALDRGGVREERDDNTDHERAAEREVPRDRARPVVQLADSVRGHAHGLDRRRSGAR